MSKHIILYRIKNEYDGCRYIELNHDGTIHLDYSSKPIVSNARCSTRINEDFEDVETWPDYRKFLPSGTREELFNCDAHLKATLLGNSATFAVEEGKLGVGKTGYVYFVDFDRTHARSRRCKVVVIGE